MRAGILIVAVIVLIAAVAFTLKTLTKGPLAFAGGRTVALADYHAADPTGVPQNLANADQVRRGEYLARAADCLVCHTAPGGADYAGGLAIPLPFGTLYTTNITPDEDTGIGNYSDQDFLDALRRGKRRDGADLYPDGHRSAVSAVWTVAGTGQPGLGSARRQRPLHCGFYP